MTTLALHCAAAGPLAGARRDAAPIRAIRALHALGYLLLGFFVFFICFTFLRPSPYDFAAIPAMALWLALGIRLHRSSTPFVALLLLYHLGLFLSLIPHLDEPRPVEWTYQSAYLMVTAIFFAMLVSDDTERRVEFVLKAYLTSCLFAAGAGVFSYFDVLGEGVLFKMDGRAAGVFEDPNVLGSFLIPGAFYLLNNLLTGRSRWPLAPFAGLCLVLAGIFFSFSRGSWAGLAAGGVVMVGLLYVTNRSWRLRRRIVGLSMIAVLLIAGALAAALTIDHISERFEDRAQVTKDYDEGVTGRFGNQLRSIPLLIERPNGFGPLRFRLIFGLEPHNSYVGGFANGGWLGGFAFIGLVLVTGFVGFRLCLLPSPARRLALVVWPSLLVFFLQALQIDVDHWRHVALLFGLLWGLEAARVRSRARDSRATAA